MSDGEGFMIINCRNNVSNLQVGGITGSPTTGCNIHNVYNAGKISKWPTPQSNEWYEHILPAISVDTEISNCYWFNNDEIDDMIFDFGIQAYVELPESSRFNEGTIATSWILENPLYNTTLGTQHVTSASTDVIDIDVSDYKSGIYFINVYDNNGNVVTKKISVIKIDARN